MSDYGDAIFRDGPHGDAHAAVRDALPALLHGRVSAAERAALEGHLAACHACDREFRMLATIRDLYAAPAYADPTPTVGVDRIAAAVRARTVGAGAGSAIAPSRAVSAPVVRATVLPPRRAPAWARRGTVRAFAASALLAIGTGAVFLHRPTAGPTSVTHAAGAPNAVSLAAGPRVAPRDPSGSLLGASFSDLSDAELAAVVAAVDDPASAAPAAEPAPVGPTVLAPDAE